MIRKDILDWANLLPTWQKPLMDKILRGEKVDEIVLEDSYKIFKIENKLMSDANIVSYVFPQQYEEKVKISQNVKWRGVKNIQGINALADKQILDIIDGVTIIYGENGSGKSGYTRIFNRAFISRGDKTLLPNIYLDTKKSQKADLVFEVDGSEKIVEFPSELNSSYCKKVSVFDTTSAINDMTNENEMSLAPVEFAIFEELAKCVLEIKEKFEAEKQVKGNIQGFSDYFTENTDIKNIIISINSKTKLADIENKIVISEEENEKFKTFNKRKAELVALNLDIKVKKLSDLSQDVIKIKDNISKLNNKFSNDQLLKIKNLISEYNRLEKLSNIEGISQFKNEDIENLGTSEWKDFISAAKIYHDTIKHEIDYCILCRQNISDVTVFDKYWAYLKSESEEQLKDRYKDIIKLVSDFEKLDHLTLLNNDSRLYEYFSQNSQDIVLEIQVFENNVKDWSKKLNLSLGKKKWNSKIKPVIFNIEIFDEITDQLEMELKNTNKTSVDNKLKSIQKFLNEYNAKLVAKELLPKINTYIKYLSWLDKAGKCNISTTLITKKRSELFSKYVTDEYIKQFELECKKLGLNIKVKTSQRGSIGSTKNRLMVKNKKPSDILSEGEQRVVALANFLAEASVSKENNCLIFDDPVSSLDHERRNLIVNRLIELSKYKQVVVMTHNISFLLALEDLAKKEGIKSKSQHIQKISDNTGILDETIPWIGMNVKSRISALRNTLQKVTSEYNKRETSDDIQKYSRDTELWCTDLRKTWERGIEEKLFNGAVERYRPSIETQKLKNAPYTKELYSEIEMGMSECSNWMHDRSPELGAKVPTPEELSGYLKHCDDFMKKINKMIN